MVSRRRTWKDDLVPLFVATLVQFVVLRGVDWARGNVESQPLARTLVDNRFFLAPELIGLVILVLLLRVFRTFLAESGIRVGEFLRSSVVFLFLGVVVALAAHLDQVVALLARLLAGQEVGKGLGTARDQLAKAELYVFLSRASMARLALDVVAVAVAFLAFRRKSPPNPDRVAAREAQKAGDNTRAGELYLKAGDVEAAKKAFRKAGLPQRVAPLELRTGNPRGAAELYEKAGDAFAWEASKAWEAAGDPAQAREAALRALVEARSSGRFDRLAEVAEVVRDADALADATRKLAEGVPHGVGRAGAWKRAAETALAAGRKLDAAECYRSAGDAAVAGPLFMECGRPVDALREFEKTGDLARAAEAAAAAGQEQVAAEHAARDKEAKGDLVGAGEAWLRAGKADRAATLFERRGQSDRAAAAWLQAGKPDRAAPLFLKVGDVAAAAAAYEASGQPAVAAVHYRQLGELERAANLYRSAGRWAEAAQVLQDRGEFEEAVSLFVRAGRGLDAARSALKAGQRERTWELLSGVRRNDAGVGDLFLDLAEAHLSHDEPKDAVHVLRELLGTLPPEPRSLPAHDALVRALEATGDVAEAADRMAAIAALDPEFRGAARRAEMLAAKKAFLPPRGEGDGAPGQAAVPTLFRSGSTSRPAPSGSFPLPGTTVAVPSPDSPERRFEIVAELGRGGMGIVHKARDHKLERFVALKILPAQLWGDETAMRYFTREARAIAALNHPNVVSLYDFGEGFGSAYLAMEYLEGANLQSLLKSDHDRVKRNWREWFVQATRGVAAAHSKGILHRDIKPANLVLDENGTIRILDFGLARPVADTGLTSKLIGTPAFFPPELLRGEPPTAASDVYSLGATFYTLAAGRWPYVGDDVLVARLERDPDDPRPYAPFLTDDEVFVLLKSIARHRPERYQDGGELLQALLSLEA